MKKVQKSSIWQFAFLLILTSLSIPESSGADSSVLISIEKLSVKGRAAKTGYSKKQFPHWADPDRNGCDARNDILKRDLTDLVFKLGTRDCKVISGTLIDPYSGKELTFLYGASTIDIDHVVAMSNAWQTGAGLITLEMRKGFANDPLNLLAVDFKLNRQKGNGDAATWLPPLKSYRCAYLARQIAVKIKYGLWLTKPEKVAMVSILTTCPNEKLPH